LREALHMKPVEDDLRLRRRFGDQPDSVEAHIDDTSVFQPQQDTE
jgi:hypothetical protein